MIGIETVACSLGVLKIEDDKVVEMSGSLADACDDYLQEYFEPGGIWENTRNAALEEAARVAESNMSSAKAMLSIPAAIRALKEKAGG